MANKNENNVFTPEVEILPGDTIRENMEFLGMNQTELAARMDITTKHLSNIVTGKAPITYDTALKLETVIGPSAKFWMNLETNYQLNKKRIEEKENLAIDLDKLKDIPYKEMSAFGWVEKTRQRTERVMNCRKFFGVADLTSIPDSYNAAFRKQNQTKEISDLGTLAWLRKAELEGLKIAVNEFNKKKLKKLIPRFREMTMEEPADFFPEMRDLCAESGVALVLVPYLPRTDITGSTIWRNNKAILALSVRGKSADIFWFTFFHELAHLIKHSKKEFHINYKNQNDENESEADELASRYLIAEEKYKKFIKEYDYKKKENIVKYSNEIGIAPFVLLGRLQHDGLLKHRNYRELIPSFEIINGNGSER